MNWTDPPPKPTLSVNGTKDALWAKGPLERYAIDFEERHTPDPFVSLHWNGRTYTDLFGIADFLMFAGRLSLPGMRTRDGTDDGELPGFSDTPLVIRLSLPMSEGARNGRAAGLHGLEKSHALREEETMMVLPVDVSVRVGRRMADRVLARMATTGIYLVRGVPRDLQRAARVRARREGTTLRWVLLQGLREYAAGTWTPHPGDIVPESARDPCTGPDGPVQSR
jgi:hypothetical protein